MILSSERTRNGLRVRTGNSLDEMVAPFTGIAKRIGLFLRVDGDPRAITSSGELSGVHHLVGRPKPQRDIYHIGAGGLCLEEVVVKTVAESIERYAQFTAPRGQLEIVRSKYTDLVGRRPDIDLLRIHTPNQSIRFARFDPERVYGWVRGHPVTPSAAEWLPAQLALVGYPSGDEPRFGLGVSTGTATHVDREKALLSAILELIQIDAAMGHWYSDAVAAPIRRDVTSPVMRVVHSVFVGSVVEPEFYLLPSADLPATIICCVLRSKIYPRRAVGLGAATDVDRAIYQSMLEAISVRNLARLLTIDVDDHQDEMDNLDTNVVWYAGDEGVAVIDQKFDRNAPALNAPPIVMGDTRDKIKALVAAFGRTNKSLTVFDMTPPDLAHLGYRVVRAWSPNLLTLCLPNLPPLAHPRLMSYGRVQQWRPHPYP